MDHVHEGSSTLDTKKPVIHRWDARTRSNSCGAPGQTGSTKHERGVTCHDCLEVLDRESRTPDHIVQH